MYDIGKSEIVSLHPFFALNLRSIESNNGELPSDLKLLPDHCLSLYDVLKNRLEPLGMDVKNLHPDKFFKVSQFEITKYLSQTI